MTIFDTCFDLLIGHEGGYVNDPRDPGGETKFGISDRRDGMKDGRTDTDGDGAPDQAIAQLTLEEAKAIYRRDYWDKVRGEDLPPAIALATFDAAVNCGVTQAVCFLQLAVGAKPDGKLGPLTLEAVRQAAAQDVRGVLAEILARRNEHNRVLPTVHVYGLGWSRRLFKLSLQAGLLGGA